VLALVEADRVDDVAAAVAGAYDRAGFAAPVCFVARASQGARRVG
jgi:galactokinase